MDCDSVSKPTRLKKGQSRKNLALLADFKIFVKATTSGLMLSEIDEDTIRAYLGEDLSRVALSTVNLQK